MLLCQIIYIERFVQMRIITGGDDMYKTYVVCKNCGTMIHNTMSACPKCGKEIKKPCYKKGVFWVCFTLIVGPLLAIFVNLAQMWFCLWLLSKIVHIA